jgi:hypothetical protein
MRTPIIPLEMTCWLGIVDQRDATLPDHGQRQESKAVLCYTNGEVETLISPGVGNAHREKRRSRNCEYRTHAAPSQKRILRQMDTCFKSAKYPWVSRTP